MKRVLLAIIIGFMFVVVYTLLVSAIIVASGQKAESMLYLDLPLRLPKIIFFYFYPPTASDFKLTLNQKQMFLGLFVVFANILIYSIPTYILLAIFSRKTQNDSMLTEPPPPPSFCE